MKRRTTSAKDAREHSEQGKPETRRPELDKMSALCIAAVEVEKLIAKEEEKIQANPSRRLADLGTSREWRPVANDPGLHQLSERYAIDCQELASVILSARSAMFNVNKVLKPTVVAAIWLIAQNKNCKIAMGGGVRLAIENQAREYLLQAVNRGDKKFFLGLGDRIREWQTHLQDFKSFHEITNVTSKRNGSLVPQRRLFPKWQMILFEHWAPRIPSQRSFGPSEPKQWSGLAYLTRDARMDQVKAILETKYHCDEKDFTPEAMRHFIRSTGLFIPKRLILKT